MVHRRRAVLAVATVGLLAACSDPSARRAADPAGPALHAFGTYRTLEGGTVVEVVFAGFPDDNGPCGADYHAVASETAERVYVQVQVLREPGPQAAALCPKPLRPRTLSVSLRAPIEGRAVVDAATGELVVPRVPSVLGVPTG